MKNDNILKKVKYVEQLRLSLVSEELMGENGIPSKSRKLDLEGVGQELFPDNALIFETPSYDEKKIIDGFKELDIEVVEYGVDFKKY